MNYSYVPTEDVTQEMLDAFLYTSVEDIPKISRGAICEFAYDGDQPECLSLYSINTNRLRIE